MPWSPRAALRSCIPWAAYCTAVPSRRSFRMGGGRPLSGLARWASAKTARRKPCVRPHHSPTTPKPKGGGDAGLYSVLHLGVFAGGEAAGARWPAASHGGGREGGLIVAAVQVRTRGRAAFIAVVDPTDTHMTYSGLSIGRLNPGQPAVCDFTVSHRYAFDPWAGDKESFTGVVLDPSGLVLLKMGPDTVTIAMGQKPVALALHPRRCPALPGLTEHHGGGGAGDPVHRGADWAAARLQRWRTHGHGHGAAAGVGTADAPQPAAAGLGDCGVGRGRLGGARRRRRGVARETQVAVTGWGSLSAYTRQARRAGSEPGQVIPGKQAAGPVVGPAACSYDSRTEALRL